MKPFDLRAGPNGWFGVSRGCCKRGGTGEGEETYRYGEVLRQRNIEERIIAGKPTTLLRRTTPWPPTLSPTFPAIPARRDRITYYTRRNIPFGALCNIATRMESRDYSEPIDDAKSRPRFAIRDTLRGSNHSGMRDERALHFRTSRMHKCIYTRYIRACPRMNAPGFPAALTTMSESAKLKITYTTRSHQLFKNLLFTFLCLNGILNKMKKLNVSLIVQYILIKNSFIVTLQ